MKKKICLMRSVSHGFDHIVSAETDEDLNYYENSEYVRLSKVIEVDFPELDNETVIKNQVAVIDKQITKVKADAEATLTVLDGRKQELLAIGHEQ